MKKRYSFLMMFLFALQIFIVVTPVFSETGFQPSVACSSCHSNRYNEWSTSAMILGINDVVFKKFYDNAPTMLKTECLYCHAPAAVLEKDMNFDLETSKEQIPCDFCHTATKLIPGKNFSTYAHEAGFGKLGNLKDPETNVHEGRYSEFHTISEFCSGCHQYKFNDVIDVDNTYEEWKNLRFPSEAKQCQECHMRPYAIKDEGKVVVYFRNTFDGPEKVAFGMDADGTAMKLLASGVKLEAAKELKKILVSITNSGAGHKLPGAAHGLRRLVLEVKGLDKSGKTVFEKTEEMGITLLDGNGKETYFFWDAKSVARDSRIPTGTTKIFAFEPGPDAENFNIRLIERLIPAEASEKLGLKDYQVVLKELEIK